MPPACIPSTRQSCTRARHTPRPCIGRSHARREACVRAWIVCTRRDHTHTRSGQACQQHLGLLGLFYGTVDNVLGNLQVFRLLEHVAQLPCGTCRDGVLRGCARRELRASAASRRRAGTSRPRTICRRVATVVHGGPHLHAAFSTTGQGGGVSSLGEGASVLRRRGQPGAAPRATVRARPRWRARRGRASIRYFCVDDGALGVLGALLVADVVPFAVPRHAHRRHPRRPRCHAHHRAALSAAPGHAHCWPARPPEPQEPRRRPHAGLGRSGVVDG